MTTGTKEGAAVGSQAKWRRWAPWIALAIFALDALGYGWFRHGISGDLFGGDAIWMSRLEIGASESQRRLIETLSASFRDGGILSALQRMPEALDHMFVSSGQPDRYLPLTALFSAYVMGYLLDNPQGVGAAIMVAGLIYGATMAVAFLFAHRLIRSVPWAIVAVLLFQTATSTLTASYMLFSLPYLFVPLVTAVGLYGYLRYKDTRCRFGLALFVMAAVLGLWIREFLSVLPFVVFASELLSFRGTRSRGLLLLCLPLMAHAAFPTFLPWLVGVTGGPLSGVFAQKKALSQMNPAGLHLGYIGTLFVQFPPLLWMLASTAISVWLWQGRFPRLGRSPPIVGRVLGVAFVALTLFFFLAFFNPGEGHQFDHPNWAYQDRPATAGLMLLFVVLVAVSAMRFGVVAPLYFLATFAPFLVLNLAEVHLAFVALPLAVILVQWTRDLSQRFFRLGVGERAMPGARITFLLLLGVALADQAANVGATMTVQRALVSTNKAMAAWIAAHVPARSIVIANFLAYADVFYYSGFSFDPYETTHNNPLGQTRTVFEPEDLRRLLTRDGDGRDIYFLAATPDYFPWRKSYHSHKWVADPPGPISKLAEFSATPVYPYLDPIKYFTPRNFISFPGYMDWETDYSVHNGPGLFRRTAEARFVLYRLDGVASKEIR